MMQPNVVHRDTMIINELINYHSTMIGLYEPIVLAYANRQGLVEGGLRMLCHVNLAFNRIFFKSRKAFVTSCVVVVVLCTTLRNHHCCIYEMV